MMGFKKLILFLAEKIKQKERLKKEGSEKKWKYDSYIRKSKMEEATKILSKYLEEKIEELEKTECHIKVGDKAILNIYELGEKKCNNGWDGGPRMLESYLKDKSKPAIFTITEVHVDSSLAYERIEKFIYKNDVFICSGDFTPESMIKLYENYINSGLLSYSESEIFNKYGLYKTARFKSEDPFQPNWGLNVNSFIPENNILYSQTHKIWKKDIKLKEKLSSLNNKIKLLELERQEWKSSYQ